MDTNAAAPDDSYGEPNGTLPRRHTIEHDVPFAVEIPKAQERQLRLNESLVRKLEPVGDLRTKGKAPKSDRLAWNECAARLGESLLALFVRASMRRKTILRGKATSVDPGARAYSRAMRSSIGGNSRVSARHLGPSNPPTSNCV